jgi:hypothetical protein
MRYFHRIHLPPDEVLSLADTFLSGRLHQESASARTRRYRGTIGTVTVTVEAEGGHYTLITVTTDQVGESEADKLAKRFLSTVHTRVDADHAVRGAY